MTPDWFNAFAWNWRESVIVALLLPAAWGWGALTLRGIKPTAREENSGIGFLPTLMTGFNLLLLSLLLLNTGGLLSSATVWLLLGIGAAVGVSLHPRNKKLQADPGMMLIMALMLLLIAPAWCLPTGWDELTYHLLLPWRWMNTGYPGIYTDLPYSGFPSPPEMLFQGLLNGGGWRSPRLCCWLLNTCFFLCFYQRLRQNAAIIPAAALTMAIAAMPVFLMLQRESFVEIFIMLNMLALVELIGTVDAEKQSHRWWVAAGICAGGCATVKLYGGAAAAAALLPLLPQLRRQSLRGICIGAGAALFMTVPFYLRPLLLTGNPVYPFYASWFGGSSPELLVSAWHHAAASAKFGDHSLVGWLTAPLTPAWASSRYDGSLGFQWLVLLFLMVITVASGRRQSGHTIYWTAAGGLYFLIWYALMPQARFLLPVLVLFAPVMHTGLGKLHHRFSQWFLTALLVLSTVASLPGPAVRHYLLCWRYLGGGISPADFVYSATGPGYLPAADMAHKLVPPGEKLLLLFDNRLLYFPAGTEAATPFFQRAHFTPLPTGPEQLLEHCHTVKARYLMVLLTPHHPDRVPVFFQQSLKLLPWLEQLSAEGKATLLWQAEGAQLYRIN